MSTVIDGTTGLTCNAGVFGDASGNVGVGTSNPNFAGASTMLSVNGSSTGGFGTKVADSGAMYLISSSTYSSIIDIRSQPLIFGTNNAERMRIDSSGNLLVGYTTSNGSYKLQVNSQIFATSAVIATSDGRYKKDIQSLNGALELVIQLNPVQFSWKQHPIHNFDTSFPTLGFIAQEVKQVLIDKPYLNSVIKVNQCVIEPEEKDNDGNITKEAVTEEFLSIAEGNMIALLTKSIQEQQILITKLTERIAVLEKK